MLEDRLAGELLDRLNESILPASGGGEAAKDEASEYLLRTYLEVVGLLPYELEPVQPSPATKNRLLAHLTTEDDSPHTKQAGQVALTSPTRDAGGWRSWALPLAAGLAVALVGVSGWQRINMDRQREEIAKLSGHLRQVNLESAELAQYRQQLAEAQAKLAVLASSGVEVCSLHPVDEQIAAPLPTATLFVAPDHQHWYLRIDGLEPSPEDHAYQLWFITDEGAQVSGGTFDPQPGTRLELTAETMPGGTVAVSVTMEPVGGSAEPSSPPLLYGDEVMRIL